MLCPVLSTCQEKVMSENEDVEVARCIRNYVGINCTTAYEVRETRSYICSQRLVFCHQLGRQHLYNTCQLEFHIFCLSHSQVQELYLHGVTYQP